MTNAKIAVIGGGIAGLVAACELAKEGKPVVVLEKAAQYGGRAMTVQKNGALFNLGGHALYRGGEADRIFRELGLELKGGSPSRNVSVLWNNQVFSLPRFLFGRNFTWPGRIELMRSLAKLARIDPHAEDIASVNVRTWIEQHIREPMVRNLFYALIRTSTFTNAPDLQCAGPALGQIRRTFQNNAVLYVEGGWQSIVDQLKEKAIRAGAQLLHSAGVVAIEHDGAVRKLRLSDGAELEVGRVIAAVPPAETFRLVRDADRTSLRLWKDQARPAMVACLDLCLKRLPKPRHKVVLGLDEPVFFSNQSGPTPSLARDGSVIHMVKYHGVGDHDPKKDEAMLERVMDIVQPGWRKEIVARRYLPNMTAAGDYMHMGRQDRTPGPAVPEIRGLYVAGDWASHGELLVDSAAASGRRAAQQLLNDLRIENRLSQLSGLAG
jgi:phytoene dehydrogenase-like protein